MPDARSSVAPALTHQLKLSAPRAEDQGECHTDVVTRIGQIQFQLAALQTAFTPPATTSATNSPSPTTSTATSTTGGSSFANALAQAGGIISWVDDAVGEGPSKCPLT